MKLRKEKAKGPTSKRYGEAFKQAVVTEVESGRMTRVEAQKRYGIRGGMTIRGWLNQYGKGRRAGGLEKSRRVVIRRGTNDRLERENRELKGALAQVTLEKVLLESLVEEASERLGVDIRKNFGLRR